MTKHEVVTDRHTFHPQTLDPRSAGKVTRYHTWERIREQSVGEHTWQLIRIILTIHPQASRELMIYAMYHDVGERVTGDVPFPVKRERSEVKAAFDQMEHEAHLQMATAWGVLAGVRVPHEEMTTLKLAEFIEMMEWGLDEMALGNQNAALVYRRCYAQASRMLGEELPIGVAHAAERYINRRLSHERKHRNLVS
jgi:5'-deoxynucleotidase YfbR-like HD superfamily hydrolase